MAATPSKSFAILPLGLTSLALIGFLMTTYWQQQRDYQALQQELNLTRSNTKEQLQQLGSEAAARHAALVKMSNDVAMLREQLEAMQANLREQTDDLNRQGEKIHGKVERLDFDTQQQMRALENIKAQLKDRTDTFVNTMLKQEREMANLNAEKAILASAAGKLASASAGPVSAAVPSSPASGVSTPVVTPAPATATPPPASSSSTPVKPVSTVMSLPPPVSTLQTATMNVPLPPVVPDLKARTEGPGPTPR